MKIAPSSFARKHKSDAAHKANMLAVSEPFDDHHVIDGDIFDAVSDVALMTFLAAAEHGDHTCSATWQAWLTREGRETDVDYMKTVECLRIRSRDGFAEITYKPPTNPDTHSAGHVIAKQETNVHLSGPDQAEAAAALLEAIGMIELARVDKTRAAFRHPHHSDTIIAIDTVAGAGDFVETEVSAVDRSAAAQHLEQVECELGIDDYPVVRLPYRDLVMEREGSREVRSE